MEGRIQEHILREWREGYKIYLQRMEGRIGEYLQRMEGRIQENIYREWRVGYRKISIENGVKDIGEYLQRMEGRIQENIYREWRVGYRRISIENGGLQDTGEYLGRMVGRVGRQIITIMNTSKCFKRQKILFSFLSTYMITSSLHYTLLKHFSSFVNKPKPKYLISY